MSETTADLAALCLLLAALVAGDVVGLIWDRRRRARRARRGRERPFF